MDIANFDTPCMYAPYVPKFPVASDNEMVQDGLTELDIEHDTFFVYVPIEVLQL